MLIIDGSRFAEWIERHTTTVVVVVEHLAVVIVAAALLVLFAGVGSEFRARCENERSAKDDSGLLLIDTMLGAGALALMALLLSALRILNPASAVMGAVALAVFVRRESLAAFQRHCRAVATLPPAARVIGVVVLAVMLVPALTPPTDWDALMYHLRLPDAALQHGGFRPTADSQAFDALVGVAHFSALPLLAFQFYEGPAVLHVLLLPLLAAGTATLAREIRPDASRWMAVAGVLGAPAVVLVAWTARIDVFFACSVLALHLAATRALKVGAPVRRLLTAALLIGVAIGVKSLAAAVVVALLPLLLLRRDLAWRAYVPAAAVALLASLPWLIRSFLIAGTPLYPLGYGGTLDPWIAQLANEAGAPTTLDLTALQSLAMSRDAFNLWDAFFAPGRLTIEGEGRFYALSPLMLLLPIGLAWPEWRRQWTLHAVVPILYILAIVLPASEINLRYLIPVYPALAAVSAASAGGLISMAPRARRILVFGLCVIALWPLVAMSEARSTWIRRSAHHVLGVEPGKDLWRSSPSIRSLAAVSDTISAVGSAEDTVMVLWEGRAMMLRQPTLMDAFNANWAVLAQLPVADRCLRNTGIRWVVLGWGALGYYEARGTPSTVFRYDEFREFADRCLEQPIYAKDGFVVFRVPPP